MPCSVNRIRIRGNYQLTSSKVELVKLLVFFNYRLVSIERQFFSSQSVPFNVHQYGTFCLMVAAQFFTIWSYMEIVSSVVSLHYGYCKSMDTFLEDFAMVLSAIREKSASSTKSKVITVTDALVEAMDLHITIAR